MADIYEQHAKAFANVEAHVILKDGERVATIAFKFPADGAGRLWAYVHWFGLEMCRGYAGVYGYDKRTAACAAAAHAIDRIDLADFHGDAKGLSDFLTALGHNNGQYWDWQLREAGFTVLQAV